MSKSIIAVALVCGFALSASAAAAGILVPLPAFPGATTTYVAGINNNNVISGTFIDTNFNSHGFFGTPDGNYTGFDFPGGSSFTNAINDAGDITGISEVETQDCPIAGCEYIRHANGTMSAITKGGNPLDGMGEQILKSKFIGSYYYTDEEGSIQQHGFLGRDAQWKKDISLPFDNVGQVRGRGLNKKGIIVGFYSDTGNNTYPAYLIKDGQASSIMFDDPDAVETVLSGVNRNGTIVGSWVSGDGSEGQPLIYDSSSDTFRVIDVPGEPGSYARQVNDSDVITISTPSGPYLYCMHKKLCPITAGAIEVKERIVPAKHPGGKQWVLCRNGCEKDSAEVHPATAAQLRDALKRDPSLVKELNGQR